MSPAEEKLNEAEDDVEDTEEAAEPGRPEPVLILLVDLAPGETEDVAGEVWVVVDAALTELDGVEGDTSIAVVEVVDISEELIEVLDETLAVLEKLTAMVDELLVSEV